MRKAFVTSESAPTLRRYFVSAFILALTGQRASAAEPEITACELLTHPLRFEGEYLQVRGVYVQLEHGAYLLPYPKCETAEVPMARIHAGATVIKAWSEAGGSKGRWMLGTMRGVLRVPRSGGPVWSVSLILDPQPVEPYDLAHGSRGAESR